MKKIIACILVFTSTFILSNAQINVIVDFNKGMDFPLSKTKIGLYQTPLTSASWLNRDIPKISELESRSMRYEIGWGKGGCYGYEMIKRTDGVLNYDFTAIDLFANLVAEQNTNLFMCHSYNPVVSGTGWKNPPTNYSAYKEVNKKFAEHWKELGLQNHYIEIWNEPDLNIFFSGTIDDYFEIYKHASEGIMEGNPDAKIGGPAGAFSGWFEPLLRKCRDNDWPLHYLSGHNYGDPTQQLAALRGALIQYKRPDVEIVMTEYAPYNTTNGDTHAGGLVERYEAGMTFFNAIEKFLSYPDLTYVHWAQYIDAGVNGSTLPAGSGDKMGLVDGNTGSRKALFNAFKIYGMMPVDRYELTSSSSNIKGFASADPNNAGVVIWNRSNNLEKVKIEIDNLPFSAGKAKLYRIDPDNSWYETGDDNLKVLETYDIVSNKFSWEDDVPGSSVVFLQFEDLSGKTELCSNPFAHIIRTHHWFFDRSEPVYADFDSKTWISRLGMGDARFGDAVIGIYAEKIPSEFKVNFNFSGNEPRRMDNNSTVNFRIDFQNNDGEFTKSVLFHGGLYDTGRDSKITWGTKEHANEIVEVNLSDFNVNISQYAPAGWNGRVIITYQMQNTGFNSRAKVFIKSTSETGNNKVVVKKEKLKIYPNPCNSILTIDFLNPEEKIKNLAILDISGKTVKIKDNIDSSMINLNVQELFKGSYLAIIRTDEESYVQKIIKQ